MRKLPAFIMPSCQPKRFSSSGTRTVYSKRKPALPPDGSGSGSSMLYTVPSACVRAALVPSTEEETISMPPPYSEKALGMRLKQTRLSSAPVLLTYSSAWLTLIVRLRASSAAVTSWRLKGVEPVLSRMA